MNQSRHEQPTPHQPPERQTLPQWNFAPAIAAWVLPGLGHVLLGHVRRGLILTVTIGLLWTAGVLIGGVSVIDRQHHPFWFLGQMLVAPSLAVEAGHRHLVNQYGTPTPDNDPIYRPSLGRVHEQGTLYTALAGLLNLLVMLDVLNREPLEARSRPRRHRLPDNAGPGESRPGPSGARRGGGGS